MTIKKISNNCMVIDNKVISYTTHVATIKDDKLKVLGYWSKTTSKHIGQVAREFNLTIV